MVEIRDLVDTSGDRPSIRLGKLVGKLLGIVSFAWFLGIIRLIREWGRGLTTTVDGFAAWVQGPLVGGLFGLLAGLWRTAFAVNSRWLADTFGALAPIAAVVEIMVLAYVLLKGVELLWRRLTGGWS